ncbi:hypothetical protein [Crocinitomix catalasitica]|uniref:hypothetical protein n=1 Tax=Crocinitomix catalasitica TaxID=184607 RepID=UPI0004829897|nr:hypothetical protein [Crocinitomix catalasitica]
MKFLGKSTIIFIGLIFCFYLSSCKKEKTKWSTAWQAPIAHGHLTINDMIPIEYTTTNDDGYLSLVIHESVFGFSLDTLIKLPDTSIVVNSGIEIPSIEVGPELVIDDNFEQNYVLDEIELKRVILSEGTTEVGIKSPWPGKSQIDFSFPYIETPDGVFSRTYFLEAGSIEVPSTASSTVDMKDFDMGLTGEDGTLINTILANVVMQSNQELPFTITSADKINFEFSFKGLVPKYAKGYFGEYHFTDTIGLALPPMKKIVRGSINLDSINLKISVLNGFNLVAQAKISLINGLNSRTGENVLLDFPSLNNMLNINPATGGYWDFVPSSYDLLMNSRNSNIIDFIELLPDSVELGYELAINPFGNITGGDDEFFPGSKFELFLDGEFPLSFGANDLTIADTFEIDYKAPAQIIPGDGYLKINYENAFPIAANAVLYMLNEAGEKIDSLNNVANINAGIYNSDTYETSPYIGNSIFNFTAAKLRNLESASKLLLFVSFNSHESAKVKIDPTAYFDFKMFSNLNLGIEL